MLSLNDTHGLFIDLRNDNDTLFATYTSQLQSPALSTSVVPASAPLHQKRGRPKGSASAKPVIYGPTPRRGRPPGTGRKQKESLLGGNMRLPVRPRGRPKKQVSRLSPPAVSIEFSKAVSHNVISDFLCFFVYLRSLSWHLGRVHGMWMLIARPDMPGLPFLMVRTPS